MFIAAIIPAAGQGKRFNSTELKQYQDICGLSVLERTFEVFSHLTEIRQIIIVVAEQEIVKSNKLLKKYDDFQLKVKIVKGGSNRQFSVYNGLRHVQRNTDIVVVHDVVRPLVSPKLIFHTIQHAKKYGACASGFPVHDTVKRIHNGKVMQTVPRDDLWSVQTPQAFQFQLLRRAHIVAKRSGQTSTDDAELVERLGQTIHLIKGDIENIKITTPEDLQLARTIFRERFEQ